MVPHLEFWTFLGMVGATLDVLDWPTQFNTASRMFAYMSLAISMKDGEFNIIPPNSVRFLNVY